MDTPITSSQVPGAVSLVAQRKAHYLDKRAKVKGGEEVQVSCTGSGFWGSGFRVWGLGQLQGAPSHTHAGLRH